MSVYKPAKSRFYAYDFQFKGRRFHGSTGMETLRKAEAFERKERERVALGLPAASDRLTLDAAAGRWWQEVGQHRDSARIIFHRLAIMIRLIGPQTPLEEISTKTIASAIERRRGETYARGFDVPAQAGAPARKAQRYALSNDTVNSDIIKRIRPILNRAENVWQVKGLQKIDWKTLALPEAETDIRHFSDPYQQAWADACGPTERFALELLMAYGLRFGELFFRPSAYLPDTPRGPSVAINKRKGGKPMLMPLRLVDARQIAARAGIAQAADLDSIWIERDERGELVTVSYAAMQSRLRKAAERAGVDHDRLIHSIRHHVGTDFLAMTGDLAATKDLLGHSDIKSTLVYAHALNSGLRDAINSRKSPAAQSSDDAFVAPNRQRRKAK